MNLTDIFNYANHSNHIGCLVTQNQTPYVFPIFTLEHNNQQNTFAICFLILIAEVRSCLIYRLLSSAHTHYPLYLNYMDQYHTNFSRSFIGKHFNQVTLRHKLTSECEMSL